MKVKRYSVVGLVVLAIVLVPLLHSAKSPGQARAVGPGAPSMALDALVLQEDPAAQGSDDQGKRLKDKTKELAEAICGASALTQSDDLGTFTAKHKDALNDSCSRARALAEEPGPEDYRAMGKVRTPECSLVEFVTDDPQHEYYQDGDDDGICITKGPDKEMCLENNDDGIGNNDGLCEKWHEKGQKPIWEPCVQTCNLDAIEADDGNFSEVNLDAMEGALDGATVQVRYVTAAVAERMEVLRAVRATSSELAGGQAGECDNLKSVDLKDGNYYEVRPNNYQFIHDLIISGHAMEQVAAICEDVAGLDVLGFNALPVCTVPRIADAVVSGMAKSYELLDDSITGARLDNALVCLEHLGKKLEGMDQKLDYLIYLLNLPQGQRPEFPKPPPVPPPTETLTSTLDSPPGKSKP